MNLALLNAFNNGIIAAVAVLCFVIVLYYGPASVRLLRAGIVRADDETLGQGLGGVFATGWMGAAIAKLVWVRMDAAAVPQALLPVFIFCNLCIWFGFAGWLAQLARHRCPDNPDAAARVMACLSGKLVMFMVLGALA